MKYEREEFGCVNVGVRVLQALAKEHLRDCRFGDWRAGMVLAIPKSRGYVPDAWRMVPRGGGSYAPSAPHLYPLRGEPTNDEVTAVCLGAPFTVVVLDGDAFFLAWCGEALPEARDLALAYLLAGDRIPGHIARTRTQRARATAVGGRVSAPRVSPQGRWRLSAVESVGGGDWSKVPTHGVRCAR